MNLYEWIAAYLEALPARIRPDRSDDRFVIAAQTAQDNGWTPTQVANVVQANNYAKARNPKLVAIMRLEDHGARPPATIRRPPSRGNASGCIVCPPGVPCDHPVTDDDRIPHEWVRERMDLIRELSRTPGLTEDEREHCMVTLIADQKQRREEARTGR